MDMHFHFHKYQGTGNDFVIVDNRENKLNLSAEGVKSICDRRFGIGADGIILLESSATYDFEMNYFNADGSKSFCGNGSRCVVQFAKALGLIDSSATYRAIDGVHTSTVLKHGISTQMKAVNKVEEIGEDYFIDTGSPHYIRFVEDVDAIDLVNEAQRIRFNKRFKQEGTNVNFVALRKNSLYVRTYERGVENETLSCGTGVTAVAIAHCYRNQQTGPLQVELHTKGGELLVKLKATNTNYEAIELIGPAKKVFEGDWKL
jgi:diaminopimelate epimerase